MRMWMIDPAVLCKHHLLGEHHELHLHRHNFVKRHNMAGRVKYPAQIAPRSMSARHDALVEEMSRRGYNHKSPYEQPGVSHLPEAAVDVEYNLEDLMSRCPECRRRIMIYEAQSGAG